MALNCCARLWIVLWLCIVCTLLFSVVCVAGWVL